MSNKEFYNLQHSAPNVISNFHLNENCIMKANAENLEIALTGSGGSCFVINRKMNVHRLLALFSFLKSIEGVFNCL